MFRDRSEAGKKLAERLAQYRDSKDAVVLALPRGGVVIGYEIAQELHLPLEILSVRKIGHPQSDQFAIGAVDDNGTTIINDTDAVSLDQAWLKGEIEKEVAEAKRRALEYRGRRAMVPIEGKVAILADDGIATGHTMMLAIKVLRPLNPAKIIVAVPVSSADAANDLKKSAGEFIALEPPENFLGSVGAHYIVFPQVEDAEVVRLLRFSHADGKSNLDD
jgi:predicted phosphoribosyltransferase